MPTAIGVAVMWAGIGLRAWAIPTLGRFFRRDIQVAGDQVVRTGRMRRSGTPPTRGTC
jgi:hypothetical protein